MFVPDLVKLKLIKLVNEAFHMLEYPGEFLGIGETLKSLNFAYSILKWYSNIFFC